MANGSGVGSGENLSGEILADAAHFLDGGAGAGGNVEDEVAFAKFGQKFAFEEWDGCEGESAEKQRGEEEQAGSVVGGGQHFGVSAANPFLNARFASALHA